MDKCEESSNPKTRQNTRIKKLIAFVSLPPPMNGQARNSKRMLEYFQSKSDYEIQIVNYPSKAKINGNNTEYYIKRIFSFFKVFKYLSRNNGIYMCAESGKGLIFLILISNIFRVFGKEIYLHFRTREFITKSKRAFKFIPWGYRNLYCIVLCEYYKQELENLYETKNIHVVSNLALYNFEDENFDLISNSPKSKKKSIVFFSNIIVSKGVYEFIDLATKCKSEEFILSGRCDDKVLESEIFERCSKIPNLIFRPDYNKLKDILPEAKLLVFPSKYPIEVEPNVIYEFYGNGIPVISTVIGCTSDLRDMPNLYLIDSQDNFTKTASEIIQRRKTNVSETSRSEHLKILMERQSRSNNSLDLLFN